MVKVLIKPQTTTVHMVISPISELDEISSPEVFIHGIPWKVEVSKNEEDHSLSVYLNCTKEDDTSNWTATARATVKLLPISKKNDPRKKYIRPHVFHPSSLSAGHTNFILWAHLLKDGNKYVQDDTIELKIEITAEDPNYLERSILKFETIDKSCDCGSLASFRLTVTNVKSLMAVRSPQFTVRGLPWDLTVYKDQSSTLGVSLSNESTEEVSCNVKMSVKLLSNTNDPIEDVDEEDIENTENLDMEDVISWNELLKPKSGFVDDNSITLEVKIEADQPEGGVANADRKKAAKRPRFECSICFEVLDNQDISTTKCGHLFCTACIKKAIKKRDVCPMCQKAIQSDDLRRLFLPATK